MGNLQVKSGLSYLLLPILLLLIFLISTDYAYTRASEPEDLQASIDLISGFVLPYAIALAAVGTISMALLEAGKRLMNSRERYHMKVIGNWISTLPEDSDPNNKDLSRIKASVQLLKLTTGQSLPEEPSTYLNLLQPSFTLTPENSLFSLELEKMLGQIESTVELVLNSPDRYRELYRLMVLGASKEDIEHWDDNHEKSAAEIAKDPALKKETTEVLSRLQQYIDRRLDTIQLSASWLWKKNNQRNAIYIGFILLFGLLCFTSPSNSVFTNSAYLAVSILGGIVAPVAKDIVAALQKVRTRG